jgi:hypothetical protein
MIPDGTGKPESSKTDEEVLTRMIELEMAQQRAVWAQAQARHRTIRTISFLFLALVVIGALLAFFFFFTNVAQERAGAARPEPPAAKP